MAPFVRQSCGRWTAFDGTTYTWHATREKAEIAAGLATEAPSASHLLASLFRRKGDEEKAAEWEVKVTTIAEPARVTTFDVETDEVTTVTVTADVTLVTDAPAASYVGDALIVDDPRAVPSWLRSAGDVAMAAKPDDEKPDVHQETVPIWDSLPDPDPLVRCPPSDPATAERYYKLLGAARKAKSPGQRVALERIAAGLEEWWPASEVARTRGSPAGVGGGGSQAKAGLGLVPRLGSGTASGLVQPSLFRGGYD